MQKRMIDALKTIPGVESVGLVDRPPLYYGANSANVFTDTTTDLRPSNVAAEAMLYNISPEYFDAARTSFLVGRTLTWHDDKNSARVAVINREFANKIFGSVTNAIGRYYKAGNGSRIQVVGIVENGKYASLAEDPQPAMFLPILQSPSSQTCLVVRSNRDLQQLVAAIKSTVQNAIEMPEDLMVRSFAYPKCAIPSVIAFGDRFNYRPLQAYIPAVEKLRHRYNHSDQKPSLVA